MKRKTKADYKKFELSLDQLRWYCDTSLLPFDCTEELTPLKEFIGQDRAVRAIEFGLSMDQPGYNVYVAGITGTGKTSMVKSYIERLIKDRESSEGVTSPDDWCYAFNFNDSDRPNIFSIPQGQGKALRGKTFDLLKTLREELSKAFSSEEYVVERKRVVEDGKTQQREIFQEVNNEVGQEGFLLQVTSAGPVLVPLSKGKPLEQSEYLVMAENKRKIIDATTATLRIKVEEAFERSRELEVQTGAKLHEMDTKVGEYTVYREFERLLTEYKGHKEASLFLEGLKAYTVNSLDIFKEQEQPPTGMMGIPQSQLLGGRDPFLPFQINVFVDNSETKGVPVIEESNPIFGNLFGKIERRFLLGGYISDHTMLKPGA
ncbi:Lon-like protease helical domain-containing protein, partial [Chloroflexota bacterium]